MKSYVIGALALLTLSLSCCSGDSSSEQQLIEEMTRIPMTFAVSQESDTRLNYINNTIELGSFYLWSQVDGNIYLKDQFNNNYNIFSAVNLRPEQLVWPGIDKTTVDFYAINKPSYGSSISSISNHSIAINNDDVLNSDLLFAYTQTTKTPTDGVVNLKFNHAMAELGILLKGDYSLNPDLLYEVKKIVIQGKMSRIYHFDTNSWSDDPGSDVKSYNYYQFTPIPTTADEGYQLFSGDDYKELINASSGSNGDTFEFLIPGDYTISVTYNCLKRGNPSDSKYNEEKTCNVTLQQAEKHRVKLTLPDVVSVN